MMMNNMATRAITGILFVVVIVVCTLYSPLSFAILMDLISITTCREFATIVGRSGEVTVNKLITSVSSIYLFMAFFGYCTEIVPVVVFIPYLLAVIYMFVSELYLKRANPLLNWAYTAMSQLYIALPFAVLNILAFQNDGTGSIAFLGIMPLSVFIFLWADRKSVV